MDSTLTLLEQFEANNPLWHRLLSTAIKTAGRRGKAAVAERLGVSRPYVSRVMSGDIYPVPQLFIDRVLARYHVVECPATLREQPAGECRRIAQAPAPTHNPMAMRIWRTCQTCQHRPQGVSHDRSRT